MVQSAREHKGLNPLTLKEFHALLRQGCAPASGMSFNKIKQGILGRLQRSSNINNNLVNRVQKTNSLHELWRIEEIKKDLCTLLENHRRTNDYFANRIVGKGTIAGRRRHIIELASQ